MIAEIIPVLKLARLEYVPISSIKDMPCQTHSKVLQHNANGVCVGQQIIQQPRRLL